MGRHAKETYTTDLQLKRLKKPGLYNVAPGLFLRVTSADSKAWVFRFMLDGKAHAMGLGTFGDSPSDVSLAAARLESAKRQGQLREDKNPIDERARERASQRAQEAMSITFRQCAEAYVSDHKAGWKNAKHAAQWSATLEAYAMTHPVTRKDLGALPVSAIDVAIVTAILKPIWTTKTETASRLRGRIEAILDWATVQGFRQGENPARWRGHLKHIFPWKNAIKPVRHHNALAYALMPDFMSKLGDEDGLGAQALRFTILTAARTNETIGMTWAEVDLDNAVWAVPPARMKGKKSAGREHRVPLSKPALAILRKRHELTGGKGYVFPGARPGKHLSNMAMLMTLQRRMGRDDLTAHGFRSTFRDWAAEQTAFPREVAEAALAHVVGDKVEAAYRRGDLFEKRRKLMNAWATYCTTPAAERGKVIKLRKQA